MTDTLQDSQPETAIKQPRGLHDVENLLLIVLVIITTVVYFRYTIQVVRWNDPIAYVYAGQQIAETGEPVYINQYNATIGPYFTYHGFPVQRHPGDAGLYFGVAIGFPLLLALAHLVPLDQALLYLVPVLSIVGVFLLARLGRMLFGRWVGLLAAGWLAFSVDYWSLSTENWSDVPAVTFVLAGMICAIQSSRKNSLPLGLLAGALLGFAVLIRYPVVLAFIPLGAYLLLKRRGEVQPRRAYAGLAAGLIALGGLNMAYSAAVFGSPLATGYAADYGFPSYALLSWQNFIGNSPVGSGGYQAVLAAFWHNLHIGLILAIIGLILMPRAEALLLGGVILFVSLFFAAFLWPSSDARFALLALPMILLAASYAIVRGCVRLFGAESRWIAVAIPLLIVLVSLPTWSATTQHLTGRSRHGEVMVARAETIVRDTEPNAIFLSQQYHDLIMYYGHRTALFYSLLTVPGGAATQAAWDKYAERLDSVVSQVLEDGTPVYLVKEPDTVHFRQGPIDPYPILSAAFNLQLTNQDPPVYRVLPR